MSKPSLLCDLFRWRQVSSDCWIEFTVRNLAKKSPIRVLVVDDYDLWRRHYSTTLLKEQGLQITGEASTGLEAVQRAQDLQPDLILLDIGLPALNGIEVARRIREVSPSCKILFVSANRSAEIAKEALNAGACGYVVKSDAASELLPAVKAVLAGKRFTSASLSGHDSVLDTVA